MEHWKKRACACCFAVAPQRLEHRCSCGQAFYCSEECRTQHAAHGSAGTAPHGMLCPALQQLGAAKKFAKSEVAMLRLMLEIVCRRHLNNQPPPADGGTAAGSAAGAAASAPLLPGGLFEALECHPPSWGEAERRDWLKLFAVLETALGHCPWYTAPAAPADAAQQAQLWQQMLSRIDTNVFGCFADKSHLFAQGNYIDAAMFNHSCDPNCAVSPDVRRCVHRFPSRAWSALIVCLLLGLAACRL